MPKRKEPEFNLDEVTKVAQELQTISEDSDKYPTAITPDMTFSTGSTLINLALSNNIDCGILKGNIVRLQGDSGSGKSAFAVELLYQAAVQDKEENYSIVYKDYENGLHVNLAKRYTDLANRIKIEKMSDTEEFPTIEGEFNNIKEATTNGNRTIRVVDSLDCLKSFKDTIIREDRAKLIRQNKFKEASECNTMMEAGKAYSDGYSSIMHPVAHSDSIVVLISQLRDTPNPRIKGGAANNTSGGRSTKFYSSYTLAFNEKEKWKVQTSYNTEEVIGSKIEVTFLKNRGTGYRGTIPIYFHKDRGFLDQFSVFCWLVDRGVIHQKGAFYVAEWLTDDDKNYRKNELMKRLMTDPVFFQRARLKAQEVWNIIQKESTEIYC